MSVLDNVMCGRLGHMKTNMLSQAIWWGRAAKEETENRATVERVIDFLEIQAIRKTPVGRLPYGLKKRVELARALAAEPSLLLLDEPMAGMNVEELRAQAQSIVNSKTKAWAAADRGYGFRLAKVGKEPVYDESGMRRRFVRFEDVFGEVPIKPPEERKLDNSEKQQAFFEKQRMKKHRGAARRAGRSERPARPRACGAGSGEDTELLRAALFGKDMERGRAASARRVQHV